MLLSAACAPKLPPEAAWEPDARALLDQAGSQFAKKQYEQASKSIDTFMNRYPTSRSRDRALYLMGEIRFSLRDYAKALAYYKEVIEEFPSSSFIIAARYKLGQCHFELKEYDLAIANLEDRSRISDPAQLKRIAEMLSVSYIARKNYLSAAKEYASLAATAQTEQQKAGYRERIREIVDKNLTESELEALTEGTAYPADLAHLKLAGMLIDSSTARPSGLLDYREISHAENTRRDAFK
jgi:TolA-binding protein